MKNVIIVGAGIAGLSAGIYAKKSGFDVTIYESHIIPGGTCTSWNRGGYLFEGGMHWLTGSAVNSSLNRIWRETGAIIESSVIKNVDPFMVGEFNGERASLYRDPNKLKAHFIEISPDDLDAINILYRDICLFKNLEIDVSDISGVKTKKRAPLNLKTKFKIIPVIPRMVALRKLSVLEYASRFKSPLIRQLLCSVVPSDMISVSLLFTLASFAFGDGGYIEGGSLAMANNMAKYFEELGGEIKLGEKIERIVIKDNKSNGVFVKDKFIQSDAVIIASDTLTAIDKLFETNVNKLGAN